MSNIQATLGRMNKERIWQAAIILQGPRLATTAIAIREFLERNDTSTLLIVTTYLPVDEEKGDAFIGSYLTPFEKQIVIDEQGPHVGRLIYLFLKTPPREECPDFWRTNVWNQNLQRLSSFVGFEYAQSLGIEFCLKCRSDSFMGMRNVCQFLRQVLKQNPLMPGRGVYQPRMQDRLIVNDHNTLQLESGSPFLKVIGDYHVCDFWMFGRTADMMSFYEMRPGCEWNEGRGILTSTRPETHLVELWLRQIGIPPVSTLNLSEVVARYLVVQNSAEVEFVYLKFQDYGRYLRRGRGYLKQIEKDYLFGGGMMKVSEWRQHVERYRRLDVDG